MTSEDAEDRLAGEVLRHFRSNYTFSWQSLVQPKFFFILVVFSLVVYALYVPISNIGETIRNVGVLIAAFSFMFGYLQWYLARHEHTFESYFGRIEKTNKYIEQIGLKERQDPDGTIDHLRNMRVFTQIDTLEYILAKYNLGFADYNLARRAIRTFIAECEQD